VLGVYPVPANASGWFFQNPGVQPSSPLGVVVVVVVVVVVLVLVLVLVLVDVEVDVVSSARPTPASVAATAKPHTASSGRLNSLPSRLLRRFLI
jgi:hypothetical protein